MEATSSTSGFDHVVVLMLENRSFDNLLGYLYQVGGPFARIDGLQNVAPLPVPPRAKDFGTHKTVAPHPAADYHQPFPDPGEVYQHVNTQLYNEINSFNVAVTEDEMKAPYNLPNPVPFPAPMDGFVNDYVNTLQALSGKEGSKFNDPDYDQYSVIMQCFTPDQVPVLSGLAQNFAVFDHWHCSVPSQTWCNRAFWHAATSGKSGHQPARG